MDQIPVAFHPESGMNEDSSSAVLEFANGIQAVYTQVFFCNGPTSKWGATLSGYSGTLHFDWYQNEIICMKHYEPFTERITSDASEGHFGGDVILARNFIGMIRDNVPSLAPIQCGLASVYACLAAKKSALSGKFVQARQVGETA